MADFIYDDVDLPDADTVAAVVADITGTDKPRPMSDAELEEWQHWREQQIRLAEERQLEYEQERFALAEAERLESEQRAAIARSERTRQLQEQMRQQSDRLEHNRQIGEIHRASV